MGTEAVALTLTRLLPAGGLSAARVCVCVCVCVCVYVFLFQFSAAPY